MYRKSLIALLALVCIGSSGQILKTGKIAYKTKLDPRLFKIRSWYDMTDRSTIHTTKRGGKDYIYQIDDKTGNGYTATQTDTSKQCYWDADGFMICDSMRWLNITTNNGFADIYQGYKSMAIMDQSKYDVPWIVRPDSLATAKHIPIKTIDNVVYIWDLSSTQFSIYFRDIFALTSVFEDEDIRFKTSKKEAFVLAYFHKLYRWQRVE